MEEKISDLESAYDYIDTVITILKKYDEFKQDVKDLYMYKSSIECTLDSEKEYQEELQRIEKIEDRKERVEQEKQYWKEAI